MDAERASVRTRRLALVGDGCVINAAVFAVLTSAMLILLFYIMPDVGSTDASAMGMGVLSIVINTAGGITGPAITWFLHRRRFHAAPVFGAILGLAVLPLAVPVIALLAWLLSMAVGPISTADWAGPLALLIVVGAAFLAVVAWRLVDAARDLSPGRQDNVPLDIARVISAVVLVAFAAGVTIAALRPGQGEMFEATIFAIAAGIAGAGMMLGADIAETVSMRGKAGSEQDAEAAGVPEI